MAATVGANGLSVVHQGSGGEASADSPDVCATTVGNSTVNIAYGNSAKSSDLADGSTTVTMDSGNSVALKGSTFSKSSGDEGGDKKGVSSGTIQGEAAFTSASPTVKIEGQGVARQSDAMTMNSGNTTCSGVQNPAFQVGTPEPEMYSVTVHCENLSNAPFKVKDGDDNVVATGELDGTGKCTLPPLPEDMRLEVEYEESSKPYRWAPGPVDFNLRNGKLLDDAFFSLAAGSQYPFWQRKPNSRAEQYQWGILSCQTYPNDTLQSMIELDAKYISPQHFTYWDTEEFAIALLKVMDKDPMEQKDVRYLVSQLLCITSPNISTSLYADAIYSFIWLDESTSYTELWANMRYFGNGDPKNGWESIDWSSAAQHINKVADAFFERFLSRLECVKNNASLTGYTEVEKVALVHIDTVKRVRKQLVDQIKVLLDDTKTKIQAIIDKGGEKPPVVLRPNQIVASTYDLHDKLYIKTPKLDKPKMELAFDLGWMQCNKTQSKSELWESLFTTATSEEHKSLIKKHNSHLNEPVRQGEMVILPTVEPIEKEDTDRLTALKGECKIASDALCNLHDDEVTAVNRHFELLDYYVINPAVKIWDEGFPSDHYAEVSAGVGVVALGIEEHLKHINTILMEVNDLYVAQVAMASRTGGMNYGAFVDERMTLLKKLDASFTRFSTKTVKIPAYKQVKSSLKLSTKSVIHNADEIIAKGLVPNLGKRMANVATGVGGAKSVGYIGLGLAAASGTKSVYEACSVNGSGECGETATREVAGFAGGWIGGDIGGKIGIGIALAIVGTASAPVIAIAIVGGAVVGGGIGGVAGAGVGKFGGDIIYEYIVEPIEGMWD